MNIFRLNRILVVIILFNSLNSLLTLFSLSI